MIERPVISIIIPTFNRADLIGETLLSIQNQTFKFWECVIVDDGSTDSSETVISAFVDRDDRFLFLKRPAHLPKGGNVCRNLGLEKARGKYIQFFDSDDLMLPEMLEWKIELIEHNNYDYVISKTQNFKHPNPANIVGDNSSYYRFNRFDISQYNYVSQKINWLTPDFLGKRTLIGNIRFNNALPSGQEYNFYCKITAKSTNAGILNKYTTLRRMHPESIRSQLRADKQRFANEAMTSRRENYKELKGLSSKKVERYLFDAWIVAALDVKISWSDYLKIAWKLFVQGRLTLLFWFKLYHFSKIITGKGHYFRKKIRNCLS